MEKYETVADIIADRDRLRAELAEQCRLLGMGSEREARLMAELERCKAENTKLHGWYNEAEQRLAREMKGKP